MRERGAWWLAGVVALVVGAAAGAQALLASSLKARPAGAAREEGVRGAWRVLVDRRLERRTVEVLAIDRELVRFRDASGRVSSVARAGLVAIVPAEPGEGEEHGPEPDPIVWREIADARADATGRIELVDGQLYPGRLAPLDGDAPKADEVRWEHPLLGVRAFPLDAVAVLATDREAGAPVGVTPGRGAARDVVVLTNGDAVSGFVESLGPVVEVDADGRPVSLAIDRVAMVRLANPARAASGVRVWLRDGTCARAEDVSFDGSAYLLRMRTPGGADSEADASRVSVASEDVAAVCFEAGEVRGLAGLAWTVTRPGPGRVFTPPPVARDPSGAVLGASEVELPGPMEVTWMLPPGASRVAGVAELPAACREMGDCVLAIEAGGAVVARERLHAGRARVEFVAEIKGAASLRVTVDEGEGGPIQDRVVLSRVVVLVGE